MPKTRRLRANSNNKLRKEKSKIADDKNKVPVQLPNRLEKLSKQVDRIRKMEGDESMFRSRLRLPYSTSEPIRSLRKR